MTLMQGSSSLLNGDQPNPPLHEIVYQQIRDMILYGDFAPGQPITIQGLVSSLGLGITPVREAIRRLTAEGALSATGTRRVLVPELNAKLLAELSFLRLAIEPHLARLAAARITPNEIDALAAIDAALDEAIAAGNVQAYLQLNYTFHRRLYAASEAEILLATSDALWLRAGPSLRVVCGRNGTLSLPDMHEEALHALRRGDAEAVARAIAADIEQGHAQILRTLDAPPDCDRR